MYLYNYKLKFMHHYPSYPTEYIFNDTDYNYNWCKLVIDHNSNNESGIYPDFNFKFNFNTASKSVFCHPYCINFNDNYDTRLPLQAKRKQSKYIPYSNSWAEGDTIKYDNKEITEKYNVDTNNWNDPDKISTRYHILLKSSGFGTYPNNTNKLLLGSNTDTNTLNLNIGIIETNIDINNAILTGDVTTLFGSSNELMKEWKDNHNMNNINISGNYDDSYIDSDDDNDTGININKFFNKNNNLVKTIYNDSACIGTDTKTLNINSNFITEIDLLFPMKFNENCFPKNNTEAGMFGGCEKLRTATLRIPDFANISSCSNAFYSAFKTCSNLTDVHIYLPNPVVINDGNDGIWYPNDDTNDTNKKYSDFANLSIFSLKNWMSFMPEYNSQIPTLHIHGFEKIFTENDIPINANEKTSFEQDSPKDIVSHIIYRLWDNNNYNNYDLLDIGYNRYSNIIVHLTNNKSINMKNGTELNYTYTTNKGWTCTLIK